MYYTPPIVRLGGVMMIRKVVSIVMFKTTVFAAGAGFCENVFAASNPKIINQLSVNSRLVEKYWDNIETKEIAQALKSDISGEAIYIQKKNYSMIASITKNGQTLMVDIPVLVSRIPTRELSFGENQNRLDASFIKILAGTLRAISELKEKNPDLKLASIRALYVKNKSLEELLLRLGFRITERSAFGNDSQMELEI